MEATQSYTQQHNLRKKRQLGRLTVPNYAIQDSDAFQAFRGDGIFQNLRKKRHLCSLNMSQITQAKTCALRKSANPQIRNSATLQLCVKRDILCIFSVSFYAEVGMTRTIYNHAIITL